MVLGAVVTAALLASSVLLVRARRRTRSLPNAFPCRIATPGGDDCYRWSRGVAIGVWVHDVLVVFGGPRRTRVHLYAVHFADEPVLTVEGHVRGLGFCPLVLSVEMDD